MVSGRPGQLASAPSETGEVEGRPDNGGRPPGARTYLFIEGRSDLESPDVPALLSLIGGLRGAGHEVSLFLVQNAVTMVGRADALLDLVGAGVTVWADDHSLAARGLPLPPADGIRLGGASDVVRILMTPGVVPVWH